jgi:hypothetical protein
MLANIDIRMDEITAFCVKWKVVEFSLFGSVLGSDFRPESDVDVLVAFSEEARWSLFDLVEMQEELKELFGREVDLVEKGTIRNPFRERSIMSTREVLYAA